MNKVRNLLENPEPQPPYAGQPYPSYYPDKNSFKKVNLFRHCAVNLTGLSR